MTYSDCQPGHVFLGNSHGVGDFVVLAVMRVYRDGSKDVLIHDLDRLVPYVLHFPAGMIVRYHNVA